MEKTVTVILSGGLGNQMFQYAAGFSYARKFKKELRLDVFSYCRNSGRKYKLSNYDLTYKKTTKLIGLEYAVLRKTIGIKSDTILNALYDDSLYEYVTIPADSSILYGQWQNVAYFSDSRNDLCREFRFLGELTPEQKKLKENMNHEQSVAVHVRRGDYLSPNYSQYYNIYDKEYYMNSLEILRRKLGEVKIYFFSDDIAWCMDTFSDLKDAIFIDESISDSDLIDFELMRSCKHFVISNSTFGWWASWLGKCENKMMIAPKIWFAEKAQDYNVLVKKSLLQDYILI